ncbi:MAG: Xaa-Pro peptidase family protein [Mariprofundaceae bacterium]|nr:Xaa-Pro peptidase family protein [Mariprofundaceae bacterium]
MKKSILMIGASEHDADMLYVSGIFVPDPFIAVKIGSVWHGLFSPLEVDRAHKQSRLDETHLETPWGERAQASGWGKGLAATAAAFLKAHNVSDILVPAHFPLRHAEQLSGWGFHVKAAEEGLFSERVTKSKTEIRHLAQAERLTKRAMQRAEAFLAESSIGSDDILLHPEVAGKVKSKHLRSVIETYLIQHGAMPAHTIVACGRESSDPHHIGHGYLRAGQPIIIDIFPRVLATGYWGDMTRTYLKGKAPERVKKLYSTVKEGQKIGLGMVSDGVSGDAIHRAITTHFDRQGFKTGLLRGRQSGFFHGTGHGVGLEIHEAPRVSTGSGTLKAGHVITIEPGLYYPGMGGVRLEDMVVVQPDGHTNLTRHPCRLEIP